MPVDASLSFSLSLSLILCSTHFELRGHHFIDENAMRDEFCETCCCRLVHFVGVYMRRRRRRSAGFQSKNK